MANYGATISFGGVTLEVTSITPTKVQKTRKSVLGKSLIETKIIGLGTTQWKLVVSGVVTGSSVSSLGTNRAAIEALDDVEPHIFVDGIHDCTAYMIPGTLQFKDNNDRGNMSYIYSFTLVES